METGFTLSEIFPGWQGRLIPSARDALLSGFECEKNRLDGLPFITVLYLQDYDEDGLMKSLQLFEGFTDKASAVQSLDQLVERTLLDSIETTGDEPYRSRQDQQKDNIRFVQGHENAGVCSVYLRSFKTQIFPGFDSKYFQYEVLHLRRPKAFGPDLFAYFNDERVWVDYFILKAAA